MKNLTLQSRVSAVLAMDFRTRDAELKVTADNGIVTITGATRWSEVATGVPAVVRQVDGVKELRNLTGGSYRKPESRPGAREIPSCFAPSSRQSASGARPRTH